LHSPEESERLAYRQRTVLRAQWVDGKWIFGFLDPATLRLGAAARRVIGIPDCPVHSLSVRQWLKRLAAWLPNGEEFPLSHVAISGSLLTLVLKAPIQGAEALGARLLWRELLDWGLSGVFLNFHPSAGNRIFASRGWRLVAGSPHATTPEGWIYGPQCFQQLLPGLYRESVNRAEEFLAPRPGVAVIDLCCGTGTTLHRWKKRQASVLGVEMGGEALASARANLGFLDQGDEVKLLQGRCGDRLPQIQEWHESLEHIQETVVYANPPRLGLEPEVLDWLASHLRPKRIAYLSCSAGTLARDLRGLEGAGYSVEDILPWDFFPMTHHVETLALLKLNGIPELPCKPTCV